MGTDISLFAEKREPDGSWAILPAPPDGYSRNDEHAAEKRGEDYQPLHGYRTKFESDHGVLLDGIVVYENGHRHLREWFGDRNYDLFAMLANLRNGVGFAGRKRGEVLDPIDEPRGIPEDASPEYREEAARSESHTFTYYTVEELREYLELFEYEDKAGRFMLLLDELTEYGDANDIRVVCHFDG